MNIVLIGAGNMATQLCHNFHITGNSVLQVYNRTLSKAVHLKSLTREGITDSFDGINSDADVYILSISDNAIADVTDNLSLYINKESIVVHTSGSTSIDVLSDFNNFGVFYPLQSVLKNRLIDFSDVPILITASNSDTLTTIRKCASFISHDVHEVEDEDRSKLHVPAVFVNNFVNYLYSIANQYCEEENLNFNLLKPLIGETAKRILDGIPPQSVQTGPAIRNDFKTLKKHEVQMTKYPEYRKLYHYLSQKIRHSDIFTK